MNNLTHIAEGSFERAVEHAERNELDMAVLKLGWAFRLAVSAGMTLEDQHAKALYARLVDALDSSAGAA